MSVEAEKELISVIVPVYNVEPYLRKSLDSLLAQSYEQLEIILIDDGSTDASGQICDEYAARDARFQVVHQKNGGVSEARNTGLRHVHGAYVGFVDADDWADPELFQELYAAAKRNGCEIAVCGMTMAYGDERDRVYTFGPARVLERREALKLLLMDNPCPSYLWNKLYRSDLLEGLTFPTGRYYEDEAVMHLLFEKANRVAMIDKPLYFYRQREGSIIHIRDISGIRDQLCALEERYHRYEQDDELRPLVAQVMLVVICRSLELLNQIHLDSAERQEKLRDLDTYYRRYCRRQTRPFSKYRRRRMLYANFPRLFTWWRTTRNPLVQQVKRLRANRRAKNPSVEGVL